MLMSGWRFKLSAGLPARDWSAQSKKMTRSKGPPTFFVISPAPGKNKNVSGHESAHTGSVVLPVPRSAQLNPSKDPIASPSGATWVSNRMRFAEAIRVRDVSCGVTEVETLQSQCVNRCSAARVCRWKFDLALARPGCAPFARRDRARDPSERPAAAHGVAGCERRSRGGETLSRLRGPPSLLLQQSRRRPDTPRHFRRQVRGLQLRW